MHLHPAQQLLPWVQMEAGSRGNQALWTWAQLHLAVTLCEAWSASGSEEGEPPDSAAAQVGVRKSGSHPRLAAPVHTKAGACM